MLHAHCARQHRLDPALSKSWHFAWHHRGAAALAAQVMAAMPLHALAAACDTALLGLGRAVSLVGSDEAILKAPVMLSEQREIFFSSC